MEEERKKKDDRKDIKVSTETYRLLKSTVDELHNVDDPLKLAIIQDFLGIPIDFKKLTIGDITYIFTKKYKDQIDAIIEQVNCEIRSNGDGNLYHSIARSYEINLCDIHKGNYEYFFKFEDIKDKSVFDVKVYPKSIVPYKGRKHVVLDNNSILSADHIADKKTLENKIDKIINYSGNIDDAIRLFEKCTIDNKGVPKKFALERKEEELTFWAINNNISDSELDRLFIKIKTKVNMYRHMHRNLGLDSNKGKDDHGKGGYGESIENNVTHHREKSQNNTQMVPKESESSGKINMGRGANKLRNEMKELYTKYLNAGYSPSKSKYAILNTVMGSLNAIGLSVIYKEKLEEWIRDNRDIFGLKEFNGLTDEEFREITNKIFSNEEGFKQIKSTVTSMVIDAVAEYYKEKEAATKPVMEHPKEQENEKEESEEENTIEEENEDEEGYTL